MKLNKLLLSAALLAAGAFSASAQEEIVEYSFKPHWYMQAQFGGQETLGEGSFGDLLCPNAQITVGRKFNPYVGARLVVNGWQSKGVSEMTDGTYKWKWNYVAPTLNVVFDMTNILGGYDPKRLCDANIFGGIGANIAFNNGEAEKINNAWTAAHGGIMMLQNIWGGTKGRFVAQFGADVNFNITRNLAIGIELQANVLPDTYNSKKAPNADWYFNGLIGLRYSFGSKYTKNVRTIEAPAPCEPEIIYRDRIVEIEKPVVQEKVTNTVVAKEPFRRDIFFTISNTTISNTEMKKVVEMADYLNAHPDAKVVITGYADKGTGTRAINLRLSKQRATTVAKTLETKFNIAPSRITVKSMGEEEFQPYPDPVQNRVAICIADY